MTTVADDVMGDVDAFLAQPPLAPEPVKPAAFPREEMLSEQLADGLMHARYPTAASTLCGRPGLEASRAAEWSFPPTCVPCAETAARFHRIDRSAPSHWQPRKRRK